jgi:hypothetical protein
MSMPREPNIAVLSPGIGPETMLGAPLIRATVAFQRSVEDGRLSPVDFAAEPVHLALRDAGHHERPDQFVYPARQDPMDAGLLNNLGPRLLRQTPRLPDARKV